jgi:hypothetical protein
MVGNILFLLLSRPMTMRHPPVLSDSLRLGSQKSLGFGPQIAHPQCKPAWKTESHEHEEHFLSGKQ